MRKLLRLINKVFALFGLKLVRILSEEDEMYLHRFFPYFIHKEIEGVKFKFFVGDTDGKIWYHLKATDPFWPEMKFVKDKIIRKGDIVFECGAHHGCTTILLSEWVGESGRVIAFEPNPSNFEIAKINISINNLKNVELINAAIGDVNGYVEMDITSSNSSVMSNEQPGKETSTVKCISLDSMDFIPQVIKIDVEGFEKQVLSGAEKILKTKPKLIIEVHAEQLQAYGTTVNELFNLINTVEYDFWIQWEDNISPVPYKFESPIFKRTHLFGLPKLA